MSQISHASLQFLKQMLEDDITGYTAYLQAIKQDEGELWSECDPDIAETQAEFDALNMLRKDKRRVRRHLEGLIKAQTEIKRVIAAGN